MRTRSGIDDLEERPRPARRIGAEEGGISEMIELMPTGSWVRSSLRREVSRNEASRTARMTMPAPLFHLSSAALTIRSFLINTP